MENTTFDTIDVPTFLGQISHFLPAGTASANGLGTVHSPAEVAQWKEWITKVADLRSLGPDWDGMGAKAPLGALVDSAVELAQFLRQSGFPPPSRIGAGPDGEILLEWQDQNTYLEAEVCKPGRAEWMLVIQGQPARHWVTG
jgi:hypothetical protein